MPKKEQKTDSESASEDGEFAVKSYVKADTKKYAPKCDIALSKELQLQYRDEILMEYKESQIVVRKRFDCRGFIHKLLKKNPNSKKRKKRFFDVCLMNDAGTAEKLLIDGLYPTLEDERGQNGVYYACIEGSFDALRAILANQVSIETKNEKDLSTPLHLACRGGHSGYERCIEVLLENNVDVDARDIRGQTPAMWAAQRGFYRAFSLLSEYGADLDAQDKEGWTCLHFASYKGDRKVVAELLEEGAAYSEKDKLGQTPWDWAMKRKFDGIAAQLDEHARRIRKFKEKYGYSP